jgi:hypothetical protein
LGGTDLQLELGIELAFVNPVQVFDFLFVAAELVARVKDSQCVSANSEVSCTSQSCSMKSPVYVKPMKAFGSLSTSLVQVLVQLAVAPLALGLDRLDRHPSSELNSIPPIL